MEVLVFILFILTFTSAVNYLLSIYLPTRHDWIHFSFRACDQVMGYIGRYQCNVFFSEIWMESDRNDVTTIMKSHGYNLFHNRSRDREEKELGGGIGIMLKA